MKDKIFILFSRKGIRSLLKKTSKSKSLPAGTYMAELNLEVDNDFFDKQIPKFNIKLNQEKIIEKEVETKKPPLNLFFSDSPKKSEEVETTSEVPSIDMDTKEILDGCLNCKQSFRDEDKILRCKLDGMTMVSCSRNCFEEKDPLDAIFINKHPDSNNDALAQQGELKNV